MFAVWQWRKQGFLFWCRERERELFLLLSSNVCFQRLLLFSITHFCADHDHNRMPCKIKRRNASILLLLMSIAVVFLIIFFHGLILTQARALQASFWKQLSRRVYHLSVDPFTFNLLDASRGSETKALLSIYEQQLARYRSSACVPTYHNQHLRLRFDLKSIAVDLYGEADSFQGSIRTLHIECWRQSSNSSSVEADFDLKVNFNVQRVGDDSLQFAFHSETSSESLFRMSFLPTGEPIHLVKEVIVDVNRNYPVETIFRLTYQWMDLQEKKTFDWPRCPLTRSCATEILEELIQARGRNTFPCSRTSTLHHSTSEQLFAEERSAVTEWLDVNSSNSSSRRRCPFETTSDPQICSPEFQRWISTYRDWHAKISASLSDPRLSLHERRDRIIAGDLRFLLYEKHSSGNADRLVHLITTYFIALLTKRVFLFDPDWSDFSEVMQSSLNYERDSIMTRLSRHLSSKRYWFGFDRFTRDYDYDRDFPERILRFGGHTGGVVHLLTSNGSVYRRFLTEDLQMNAEKMFGCLYHSLFVYRLSALIDGTSTKSRDDDLGHSSEELLQILLSTNFYPIGVQVRVGDEAMKNTGKASTPETIWKSSEHFLRCAADLRRFRSVGQVPIIYLLADAVDLRRTALQRSQLPSSCLRSRCEGEKDPLFVISSSDPVLHISYSSEPTLAFRLAMFDIFLFSLCEQYVITAASGFGRVAVFASLKRRKIHSLTIDEGVSCPDQISLEQSGRDWSNV